jgi:hypothetical protein
LRQQWRISGAILVMSGAMLVVRASVGDGEHLFFKNHVIRINKYGKISAKIY